MAELCGSETFDNGEVVNQLNDNFYIRMMCKYHDQCTAITIRTSGRLAATEISAVGDLHSRLQCLSNTKTEHCIDDCGMQTSVISKML